MLTHLLSLLRQADALDRAGDFERADVVFRTVEATIRRPQRLAANPITDWSDFAHNTDLAYRNWRDSGGGIGYGMLQGNANPQALLATMRESLNRLRGRLTDPATRISVENRALCTRILDMAIQTLAAYDPEQERARAEQRVQQLPQMTLNPSASAAAGNVRLANDDSRIVGDIADARGAIAYLADEGIFAGGRAIYGQLIRGLDTMASIVSGATTPQQATTSLSPQPVQTKPGAPTSQTARPAVWNNSLGGYDREGHINRYLQFAAQQRLDSTALMARLRQHEGDTGFIADVMRRFNQQQGVQNQGGGEGK